MKLLVDYTEIVIVIDRRRRRPHFGGASAACREAPAGSSRSRRS